MVINLAQFEEPFQIIKKWIKKLYFKNENLGEQQNFSIINHFFILIHQMDFFVSTGGLLVELLFSMEQW